MTRRNAYLAGLLAAITSMAACQTVLDPDAMNVNNGEVDFTTFAGLTIYGELTAGDEPTFRGSLDLSLIQTALFTQCFDEVIKNGDDPLLTKTCIEGYLYAEPGTLNDKQQCEANTCMAQLFNCLGYKNLELAEAVGIYEFPTEVFMSETTLGQDGVIRFKLVPPKVIAADLTTPAPRLTDGTATALACEFRIPPLTSANRTLPLLAAQYAFRQAGILSAQSVDIPTCIQTMADEAVLQTEGASLFDFYAYGFSESSQMFAETTEALIGNQINVGTAGGAKQLDPVSGQELHWEGVVNSRMAAMKNLVGDTRSDTSKPLLEGCPAETIKTSHRAALNVLRNGRVQKLFNIGVSDEEVLQNSVDAIFQQDLGAGDLQPSIDDFMERRGFTISDVAVARNYLFNESRVLNRQVFVDPNNSERLTGVTTPHFQHPGAYHLGRGAGSARIDVRSDPVSYANLGAVQALDYFRFAANNVLRDVEQNTVTMSEQHRLMFVAASLAANRVVGDRRLSAQVSGSGANATVNVIVEGVRQGETIYAVGGQEGYRCLSQGTIDGQPCNPADWILATGSTVIDPNPGQVPAPLDRYVVLRFSPQLGGVEEIPTTFDEVFIYSNGARSPSSGSSLMGSLMVEDGVTMSMPLGGRFQKNLLQTISQRLPDNCGTPAEKCDFGLPDGFVPTLENELSEDNDPYENSWKHYLTLAKSAAVEADRLGEQLVEFGLQMDLRAEGARQELEELCGGVVENIELPQSPPCSPSDPTCDIVSDFLESNPNSQISQCLDSDHHGGIELEPFVALGSRPVCVYQWKNTSRICACSDDEEQNGYCVKRCPILAPVDSTSSDDCEAAFRALDTTKHWNHDDEQGEPAWHLVDRRLNIFQSETSEDVVNCEALTDFKAFLATNPSEISAKQRFQQLMASQRWWLNGQYLTQLSRLLRFNEDHLFHYTVSLSGNTLWTTKVTDPNDCPHATPWDTKTDRIDCLNPNFASHPAGLGDVNAWGSYLFFEFATDTGVAHVRRNWGQGVRSAIMRLGMLTGEIKNVVVSRKLDRSGDPNSFGDDYTKLPVRERLTGDKCQGEPCRCLANDLFPPGVDLTDPNSIPGITLDPDDPNVMICDSSGKPLRYDCRLKMEVNANDRARVYTFWDRELFDWLGGVGANGVLWTLRGGGGSSCDLGTSHGEQSCQNLAWVAGVPTIGCIQRLLTFRAPKTWDKLRLEIDRESLFSTLEMACYLTDRLEGACATDLSAIPEVDTADDIDALGQHVTCLANSVRRQAELLVIPKLPRVLVEGFQRSGIESQYPGLQGEALQLILAMESDLRRFANNSGLIQDILFEVAQYLGTVKASVEKIGLEEKITRLRAQRNQIAAISGAILGLFSFSASGVGINPGALSGLFTLNLDQQISETQEEILNKETEIVFQTAMSEVGKRLTRLRDVLNDIAENYKNIQSNLGRWERLQDRVSEALANITFADKDVADRVLNVNTVMRRRQNTLRKRYQAAFARAKKLAYIARRAIEFRLGVDMNKMTADMTLVPAPNGWADRICEMRGFSYERLRDAFPDDLLELDPELQDHDDYVHWYIGDYVTMLEDFVESYNLDEPFTDENDLAVVSLRDDLMGVREWCDVESHNLIFYSDRVGRGDERLDDQDQVIGYVGWRAEGCVEQPAEDLCLEVSTTGGLGRIADRPFRDFYGHDNRAANGTNTGYFAQQVETPAAGVYILSWESILPEGVDPADAVDYRVEIVDLIDPNDPTPIGTSVIATPEASWTPHEIRIETSTTTTLEIRFHPSDAPDSVQDTNARYGNVLIRSVQFEWVDPWRCRFDETALCSQTFPLPYQAIEGDRTLRREECQDLSGRVMRARFERRCLCENDPNALCDPDTANADLAKCFRQADFSILLEDIESGAIIPSNNIALRNFNYRLDEIAVNLVGTNIRRCDQAELPGNCVANAFIPYTLQHQGTVPIRNHTGQTEIFSMPSARLEHAKALTAEVLLTNPLGSTHQQLIQPYIKTGLRGRPMQGQYVLRIWETPELDWTAIEDVQIVFRYRYWTQMGTEF